MRWLPLPLLAALLGGCTAEVRESDLIRPVSGGALIGEADLYAASPLPEGRKTLQMIGGAGHADVMTRPAAIDAYRAFLQNLD